MKKDAQNLIAQELPGITSKLGVLSKNLVPWATREAGKAYDAYFRNLIDEAQSQKLEPEEILDRLRGLIGIDAYQFSEKKKEEAGQRGTDGHALSETIGHLYRNKGLQALSDEAVREIVNAAAPLESDDCYLIALAFRNWLARVEPEIISIEKYAACVICGYAVTTDLVWRDVHEFYGGGLWNSDIKTSRGIYAENALQVVGQIHAILNTPDYYHIERSTKWGGHRYNVYSTKGEGPPEHILDNSAYNSGLLWINPDAKDGCELVPTVNTPRDLRAWSMVNEIHEWRRERNRKKKGFPAWQARDLGVTP